MNFYKLSLQVLIIISVLFTNNNLNAQNENCGFRHTTESLEKFNSIRKKIKTIEEKFIQKRHSARSTDETPQFVVLSSIPVKAHIIRQADASGGLTETQLNNSITTMNTHYANAGIEFFLCDGINYINNDSFYDFDKNQEPALFNQYTQDNMINIYFANSVTSSGNNLCGYARPPESVNSENILMANQCATNGSTLSHEVGHFFGLMHTHGSSNVSGSSDELVNGSNCDSTGDYICDTPADPKLSNSNVNLNCEYNGAFVDANSQLYQPQTNNIMSYSRKSCRNTFTPQQLARINAIYQTTRSNLACPSLYADFNADRRESCIGNLTVNFTDNSIGATTWSWDVNGDGVEDYNTKDISHTYQASGNYDVALIITNEANEVNTLKTRYMNVGSQEINTETIELNLTLDDYPNETTWKLIDGDNNEIYTGGPYINGTDDFTTITETFEIDPNVCYSFVMMDSFGDGICCSQGDGQYTLSDDSGNIFASGGNFETEQKKNFKKANALSTNEFKTSSIKLYPNPATSYVTISSNLTPDSYSIITTLGQVIKTQKIEGNSDIKINVEDLNKGVYFIKLNKDNSSQTLSFIKK